MKNMKNMTNNTMDNGAETTVGEIRSLSQARSIFNGATICELGSEFRCGCTAEDDNDYDCAKGCKACPHGVSHAISCRVAGVHSTRHSFLLQVDGFRGSIIIPKGLSTDSRLFPFVDAGLSETTEEQLANLGLDLPERRAFYVRTWKTAGSLRWREGEKEDERFVIFTANRKEANGILLFTPCAWRTAARGYSLTTKRIRQEFGVVEHDYTDARGCKDAGYESWLFSYDRRRDCLRIPADPIEDEIGRVVELLLKSQSGAVLSSRESRA